jgi:hypothetical protein
MSATAQQTVIDYVSKNVVKRIKAFGERRVTYHVREVSGDREAYNVTSDGGFGDRRITDLGYLRLEGRDVFGWMNFDANVQDSRFLDPQAQRYRIWFDNSVWSAEYGDIKATLPTRNRFVTINNTSSGFAAGYKSGPMTVGVLRTDSRGEPRSVSIQGTNSAGPYYLQSSQIIRGSERIELDGIPQSIGQDYTIDYDLGAITFVNRQTLESKIIAPTSTIVATYESFNFAGSAGRIEGIGLQFNAGMFGRVGVTAARQVTGATGSLSSRLEKFAGFGPAGTPYFLQFQPLLTQPIVIRVDGVLQTQNIDWRLDNDNPSIFYFNRFMPSTSQIDVIYTPQPTGQVAGDREVLGVDYTLTFGKTGSLNYVQATGRSTKTPTPTSGTARGLTARYGFGPWNFSAGVRDVPAGYVSIQTATLNRNERVNDWTASLKAGPKGTVQVSNFNSRILSFNGSGVSATPTRSTRTSARYELSEDPKVAFPLALTLGRNQNQTATSANEIDSLALSTSRIWGPLSSGLTLDQQRVRGSQRADVTSLRLNNNYAPSKLWGFDLGIGFSRIKSGGQVGNGRDISGSVRYQIEENFVARLTHSDRDSGSVSSVPGLETGYGAGLNGNGFTSGTGIGFGNEGSSGRSTSLLFQWQPTDRLAFRATGTRYEYAGSVSSNTRTEAASLGVDWDLGGGHSLGGDIDLSTTTFIGTGDKSTSTGLNGFINGRFGKLGYRAGGTVFLSGGGAFSQDNISFDFALDYRLAERHALGFTADYGNTSGYLPQSQLNLSAVYQYQIWQNLALNVRYRFADNRNSDPFVSSGAFRANTLDFELAFNFGR